MKNKAMRGVRTGIAACALLLSVTLLAAAGVYLYQIRVWKDGQGLFQDLPFFAYEGLWPPPSCPPEPPLRPKFPPCTPGR